MKKITVLLFIFIYGAIQAQIINFPDENLKNALLNHNPIIDTNNDGEIEISEAENYSGNSLELSNKEIMDIVGLENFTSTERFFLNNNDISSIDISILFWAKELWLNSNELTEIDLSSNVALEELRLGFNELLSLDISNNVNLIYLSVISNNLISLDTSNNILLEELRIEFTDISSLDVSSNNLKVIKISSTPFTTFDDFSSQIELEWIDISNTVIPTLDTSIFPDLKSLQILSTELLDIDLSQNTALQFLSVGNSDMTSIDVSYNLDLRALSIHQELTSIDVSQNIELRDIVLINNSDIISLDLSANPNICRVTASNTSLEYINIKNGNNTNLDPSIPCYAVDNGGGIGGVKFKVAHNNDNLAVICVDNVDFAIENFEVPEGVTLLDSCPGNLGDTNQIVGTMAYDENEDGCDPDDQPIYSIIHSTDGVNDFATIAASTGDYNLHVFEGTYDTQIIGLPDYFITDPAVHQNTFTGFDQIETIDFCITATEAVNDLSVTLMPTSQARPGFESSYQIVYSNIGTTTVSGTIDFSFNEALVGFQLSSPSPTNTTVNSISWDFENLPPFTSRTIDITMLVEQPPVVEGDDILQYVTSITPSNSDVTPNDNTFELNQVVVNSYDPNDKTCLEGEEVLIENADEYLHYLVRFQNTGTASAINVRVADQLDEKLDWTTLVIESLSHPGRTEIQNGRDVSFIFDDIYLPHEAADPEGSNGFIAYKIKPKEDVVLGDTIENTAYIFFDFNPPIITNTTETTFVETLAVDDVPRITLGLYPNPTSDILYINSNESLEKLTIYNSLGQSIRAEDVEGINSQIDMSDLDTGIYFISLQTISGSSEYRQIIKK